MPFPWKKVKTTRISQLVNDHLHNSQKRRDGSSLVVETGFPTSLVDLFIKNREKLKKPSKKKRQTPATTSLNDADDQVLPGSPISFPSRSSSPSPVVSPLTASPTHPTQSSSVSPLPSPSGGKNEVLVMGSSDGGTFVGVDEMERGAESGADKTKVLFVVLKMFFVLLLALGTKRLTVGITISAFLLFFLEYAGEHMCNKLLKPLAETKGVLRSMLQSVRRLLRFKDDKFGEKNGVHLTPELQQEHSLRPSCSSLKSSASKRPDQEIQIVELQVYLGTHLEEIQPEDEIMDEPCFKGRLRDQEIESKEAVMAKEESLCEVPQLKTKSRRARIKSKMKKFVPKKFRSSRKEHDPQRLEIVKEDSVFMSGEQEVDQCKDAGGSQSASELSSISSGRYKEEEDDMSAICGFGGLSEVSEEAADTQWEEEIKGEEKTEAGLTWRYLILCLVVLIGLVGGRAFALLLTLSWCLLLKLGETLPSYLGTVRQVSFEMKMDMIDGGV